MPLEEDFATAAYEVTGTTKTIRDAWSGDHLGFYSSLGAVNRTDDPGKRSYAATGYIRPNVGRPNLKVLTEAHVGKIVLDGKRATGVEFYYQGQKHTVSAKNEVVLSAGVIQTPQLLELSGVGDPAVLEKAGVECKVENIGVGANFQDHVLGGLLFDLKPGVESMDALHTEEFMKAQQDVYETTQKGVYASPGMMMGFVSYASIASPEEVKQTIADIKKTSQAKTEFAKAQEKIIIDQLADPTFANLQTFCIPCRLDVAKGSDQTLFFGAPPKGKQQLSLLMCLEHPLSRGTVHITSSDPMAAPEIDPGYFRNEIDAKILAAGVSITFLIEWLGLLLIPSFYNFPFNKLIDNLQMKWMDKVSKHPLMAAALAERELPPQDSQFDSEEARIEYVKNHISTQYHLIGTAALGQVVDTKLKVKGVDGLRVVDASIFPGHVSGNIMSSTYAVAEKGADIIKADYQ